MRTDKRWRKVHPSTGVFYTRWIRGYKCRVEKIWPPDDGGRKWAYLVYGEHPELWSFGFHTLTGAKSACYAHVAHDLVRDSDGVTP